MGNEESKKDYYVSGNESLEQLKKDILAKCGNMQNNLAFKEHFDNIFKAIQKTVNSEGTFICRVNDMGIQLEKNAIFHDMKKGEGFYFHFYNQTLEYNAEFPLKKFDNGVFKVFESVRISEDENGLDVNSAKDSLWAKDEFSEPYADGRATYQRYTKDGIEMYRTEYDLARFKELGKKNINDIPPVHQYAKGLWINHGLDMNTVFPLERKTVFRRNTVDTVNALYEYYHAGNEMRFEGEASMDDRHIHSLSHDNFETLVKSEEFRKPIMPESMEEIEKKIQRVPVEFQEALRKMAPARVNYSNDKIPEFSFETRGMAR